MLKNETLRRDADAIIRASLNAVLPDEAVRRALKNFRPQGGRVLLVAAGKAAWQMAHAAVKFLGRVDGGVVVTKYGHVKGTIPGVDCCEAGHPVPDENGFAATRKALELVQGLTAEDTVLFLLSGGGSALFEKPLIPGAELQQITGQLLASGADIVEMNTIRKRLSGVKGGRFAQSCAPAQVFSIVLSDILGDPLDMIASGPAVPDTSTCAQALAIAEKYHLQLSAQAKALLAQETPKVLDRVATQITGSVRELCSAAANACRELGYEPVILTDRLCCEAREAGSFLGSIARTHAGQGKKLAFLAGGETVVHLTGTGLGGRNQELALAAAPVIAGLDAAVFSVGIVCAALGRLDRSLWADASRVLAEVSAMTAGLTEKDFAGVTAENAATVGQKLYIQYGITGVRGQVEAGLPAVLNVGLPVLEEGLAKGYDFDRVGGGSTDTNIIARSSRERQLALTEELKALLAQTPYPDKEALAALDDRFIAENLSPGGSADLLALTWLLHFVTTEGNIDE
jgi:glycerate 2-kinase